VQGARAYILPAVAALLLAAWWIFGPDTSGDPAMPETPASAEPAEPVASKAASAPAGPLDRALDEAIAGCGDPAAAGVTGLKVRLTAGDDDKARIETIELTPAAAKGTAPECLAGLAGTSLPTPAPVAPVTRTRAY
jgi:hypothetical protein